ncbi:MAG: sigma-54 dependent transcriptional regulator [Paraprevotella sp.]|nr:sigma-54 dependent transcriptional regulator [Paraprevotella sp.]
MVKNGTLLVVDDNKSILTSLRILLGDVFERVITISSPNGLPSLLRSETVDAVLLDMNYTSAVNNGNEGLYWLREIKQMRPHVPVVLFTAYADIELAVKGVKEGAADFVVKPWNNAKLIQTLQAVCEEKQPSPAVPPSVMEWGTSAEMAELRERVKLCSTTDANILITGENGTGKEMLAREIHALSNRCNGAMVAVDMGAIPETLFESELFGYVKGAFTGAWADRKGRFEAADGGTLFLDEIGNLPLHQQAKLLTCIQQKQIVRVGSNQPRSVDIRLICATNCHLEAMVEQAAFREDLFYRINTIHLHLPSLRERRPDILPLARMFLKRYAEQYRRPVTGFTEEAVRLMNQYPWYGNIRELQHTVEKAVILCESDRLNPGHLDLSARMTKGDVPEERRVLTLEQMEMEALKEAVSLCKGNYSLAASRLGISRQTLYNKMKRYGL